MVVCFSNGGKSTPAGVAAQLANRSKELQFLVARFRLA
jgi:hypothetical protein